MTRRLPIGFVLLVVSFVPAWTQNNQTAKTETAGASGLYIKVLLPNNIKMSKLKPGDMVEGSLAEDVYSSDRKLFSLGDRVRLAVDHLEQRRRAPNDHWPGVIQLFTPRHEKYPVFGNVIVTEAGKEHPLQTSLIAVRRMREIYAKAKQTNSAPQPAQGNSGVKVSQSNAKKPPVPTMVLEAYEKNIPASASESTEKDDIAATRPSRAGETLPIGTRFKVVLLGNVSASKSKPGDVVQARLLEPVFLNSSVALPAGSMLEGKVVKNKPPRWLSRAGSLYLTFDDLTLPQGNRLAVVASLAGAELDQRSHTKMDAEGGLQGEHPGKAWMAINLGVTAGVAKVADDTLQLIIESIVSTATDASTAGVGRIAATCASGIYLATRKGRDVVLPRFTEMDVSLDRPLSLDPAAANGVSSPASSGK